MRKTNGEAVLHKPLPNAFAQTDLDAALKKLGRPQLVFAGFMTHMCVSSTARAALDLGYKASVAADAAATRDLPDPMGGTIAADALHRAALAALADRFAIVAKVDEIAPR
jgi:nicotinamidase-related amidase